MRLRYLPAVVAVLLLTAQAQAAQYIKINKTDWQSVSTLATATAINSAVWTGWLDVDTARAAVFEITYTNSAGTAVTMVCETSEDSSTANGSGFELHVLSTSSGTSTSVQHTWSNAVAGNELWTWTVSNLPHSYVNCAFTATGGDANDKAIVRWRSTSP